MGINMGPGPGPGKSSGLSSGLTIATSSPSSPDNLWEDVSPFASPTKVFMEVYGDTGTGRSTFALGAPGPIAYLQDGEKLEGIINQFANKIGPRCDGRQGSFNFAGSYIGDPDIISAQADAMWARFQTAYIQAESWARTIIVDTHPSLWELVRLSFFGAIKPEKGRQDQNWAPPNSAISSLYKRFRFGSYNLILIGQTADEYGEEKKGYSQRTGRTIRSGGFKRVPYMVDVIVRTSKDAERRFYGTVEKGWMNAEVEGVPMRIAMPERGKASSFATIMTMVTEEDKPWLEG
jgi:hypothetical protein